MLTQHIALVPEAAGGISTSDLARVSAALQKQVTRDFAPTWNVVATVDAFPTLEDVPVGYWPIIVAKDLSRREAGVHRDERGQPYALVGATGTWSLVASRACLEMLVNPFGDRTLTVPSPRSDQGFVELLLEVCAPCADLVYGYLVNDVVVADFCTPAYFAFGSHARRDSCSHRGALSAPLQLREGGHLTWYDPSSHTWWMRSFWADNPIDTQLHGFENGAADMARERAHTWQASRSAAGSLERRAFEAQARVARQRAELAAQSRALRLRALLAGGGAEPQTREGPPSDARDRELIFRTPRSQTEAPRLSAFAPAYPHARSTPSFVQRSYDEDDIWGEAQVLTTEVELADVDRTRLELADEPPGNEHPHESLRSSEPPPLPHELQKRADVRAHQEPASELSSAMAPGVPARSSAAADTSLPKLSTSADQDPLQAGAEASTHTSSIAPVAAPASVHPVLRTRAVSWWRMGTVVLAVLLGVLWIRQSGGDTTHAASSPRAAGPARKEVTREAPRSAPPSMPAAALTATAASTKATSMAQAAVGSSVAAPNTPEASPAAATGKSESAASAAPSRSSAAPSSSDERAKRHRARRELSSAPEPALHEKVNTPAPLASASTAGPAAHTTKPTSASIDSLIDTRE